MAKVVGFALQAYGYATGNSWLVGAGQAIMVVDAAEQSRRQRRRAIAEHNAALQDRLEMVDITPDAPRTLALGRVRAVEGVRRRWTSGANDERLTMVVSFAGHEIDGYEQWYLDDNLVALDSQGWVTTAPYAQTQVEDQNFVSGVLDSAGQATATLPVAPHGGTVQAVWSTGTGDSATSGALTATLSGLSVALSGGPAGAAYSVTYARQVTTSYVRIRPYVGTSSQNVGADLVSEYPGKITATDRFAGMALAVVDVIYSPDVFPQGRPNVTAVFRGARCLDPRTGTTAFTENPALHAYHYARWANGWAVPAEEIRTADVVAAANACDVSTVFTLRKPGDVVTTVTLPRYRSGIVISSAADPRESMAEIIEAMAGSHGWAGGEWRLRAGVVASPVFNVQPGWIAQPLDENGAPATGPVVRITNGMPREQRVNRVGGKCVDPSQRWQILPFPAVKDAVLAAANGEAALEVEYQAVNHVAHAQHLASIAIRQAQAPLRLELQCGLDAWRCELFDVGTVNLPRFGFTDKTVEVVGWRWHPTQGVTLRLAEIAAAIYTPVAELVGRDPAPDSALRRPWQVPALGAITVTSGTAPLTDGSFQTRTRVEWAPVAAESVRNGGQVEVQYARVSTGAPAWAAWPEPGNATAATIPGLLSGAYYLLRARAVQQLPLVRGAWSPTVLHKVAQVPQVTLASLGYTGAPNATAGSVLNNDPGCSRPALWSSYFGSYVVQTVADGVAGPTVFRKGAGGGNTVVLSNIMPLDRQKTFRFKAWARKAAGADGVIYPAVALFDAAGAIIAGDGIHWAYFQGGTAPTTDWAEYGGTFGAGTARPFPANARSIAVGAYIAYDLTVGYHELQGVRLEEVTDQVAGLAKKVTTFQAASPPVAEALGDLWMDTDDGNKLYRWSGAAWVALPVGTGALAAGAATTVSTDDFDFGGATFGTATARTFVVTPVVDCSIEFTASLYATNVIGDAGNQVGWYVTPAGGAEIPLGGAGVSNTAKQQITSTTAFAATGGVALTFSIKVTRPTGNPAIGLFASQMRMTQIKR